MARAEKSAQLNLERVEDRVLLAGSVDLSVKLNDLNIDGDDQANSVVVVKLNAVGAQLVNRAGANAQAGDFVVIATDNTDLTSDDDDVQVLDIAIGSISDIAIVQGAEDIDIDLVGGDDTALVGLPGAGLPAQVTALLPLTAAEIAALGRVTGEMRVEDVTVETGDGVDFVLVSGVNIVERNDLVIRTGDDTDIAVVADTIVGDRLTIDTNGGDDALALLAVRVANKTEIDLGDGDDLIATLPGASRFADRFDLDAGEGNDAGIFRLSRPVFGDDVEIDGLEDSDVEL